MEVDQEVNPVYLQIAISAFGYPAATALIGLYAIKSRKIAVEYLFN